MQKDEEEQVNGQVTGNEEDESDDSGESEPVEVDSHEVEDGMDGQATIQEPGNDGGTSDVGSNESTDENGDESQEEMIGALEGDDDLGDDDLDENEFLEESEIKESSRESSEDELLKNQLEAILFVASNPVSAEEASMKLGVSKKKCEAAFNELAMDYLERSTALEIAVVGGRYVLQLKPEFTSHVKSFASGGLIREAVMRTLTIIASKQPILQSELSKLRSSASEHVKELDEMGLISKVKKGRTFLLTTTDKFADMFGFSRDVARMKEQIKTFLLGNQ